MPRQMSQSCASLPLLYTIIVKWYQRNITNYCNRFCEPDDNSIVIFQSYFNETLGIAVAWLA